MGPLTLAHSGVSDLDISTICLLLIADIRLTDLGHELYLDLSRGGGDEVVVGGIGQGDVTLGVVAPPGLL